MRPLALVFMFAATPAAALDCAPSPGGAVPDGCLVQGTAQLAAEAHRLAQRVVDDATAPQADRDAASDRADPSADCGRDQACAARAWTAEIAHLRMTYAPARDNAPGSLSLGPILYSCDGHAPFSAVFVNGDLPAVWLSLDGGTVLPETVAASGARYAIGDGPEFWARGYATTLTLQGQPSVSCKATVE